MQNELTNTAALAAREIAKLKLVVAVRITRIIMIIGKGIVNRDYVCGHIREIMIIILYMFL